MHNAVEYNGNEIANTVANETRALAREIDAKTKLLKAQYFELTDKLMNTTYVEAKEQTVAMRRLGQLAECIGKLEQTKTKLVRAGCWLD